MRWEKKSKRKTTFYLEECMLAKKLGYTYYEKYDKFVCVNKFLPQHNRHLKHVQYSRLWNRSEYNQKYFPFISTRALHIPGVRGSLVKMHFNSLISREGSSGPSYHYGYFSAFFFSFSFWRQRQWITSPFLQVLLYVSISVFLVFELS